MNAADAEDFTQALGQVVSGSYRLIAQARKLGVPKALGLSTEDWVNNRLGGYVRYSIAERRKIVAELANDPNDRHSQRAIAEVLGVGKDTVARDLGANAPPGDGQDKNDAAVADGTGANAPLDTVTSLAADARLIAAAAKQTKRDDRLAAREAGIAAARANIMVNRQIIPRDFRSCTDAEIPDGSVDLIFTDPPYNRASVGLYADLADFAARKLVPGGSLITYLGDYALPEVMVALTGRGLAFVWPLVCLHTGHTRMFQWGPKACINIRSKLMLWFTNGADRFNCPVIDTVIESSREKDTHEWQQSLIEASYLLQRLVPINGLVVDPFCGGGTTCIAAKQLNRNWLAFEIDETTMHNASCRIDAAESV